MRELVAEVLELQREWTATNTPAMRRRGTLIRKEIPNWFRSISPTLERALGPAGRDLFVEGRDGTGPKSEIPWVRFSSRSRSPNARTGWYVVLLIHAKGEGAYLWLGHGSTRLENNTFVPRSNAEVAELVTWGRGILREQLSDLRLVFQIDLGSNRDLAEAYQKSALAGFWYAKNDLPADGAFAQDCAHLASVLGVLYEAQDLGRAPQSVPVDVEAAVRTAADLSRGRGIGGQGFGLSAPERQAVEKRAMHVVRAQLELEGFEIQDVSATHPVDYIAKRDGTVVHVEVKGTTGGPGTILLTANEVAFHLEHYPNNALFLVHAIDLRRDEVRPTASGGLVMRVEPWSLAQDRLKPISYQYVP